MNVLVISGGRLRSHEVIAAFEPVQGPDLTLNLVTWAAPTQALIDCATEVVVHGELAVLPDPVDELGPDDTRDPALDEGETPEPSPSHTPSAALAERLTPARVKASLVRRVNPVAQRLPDPVRRVVWDSWLTHGQRQRSSQLWRASRRHPEVDQLVAAADMIVAVDQEALRATWWLGRRNRTAELVLGLGSATALLVDRRDLAADRQALTDSG